MGPVVAPGPTWANSVRSEPASNHLAGTLPIMTLVTPPSSTKPKPEMVTVVPGQYGSAAAPPTTGVAPVICTAKADAATTRVDGIRTATHAVVRTSARTRPTSSRFSGG